MVPDSLHNNIGQFVKGTKKGKKDVNINEEYDVISKSRTASTVSTSHTASPSTSINSDRSSRKRKRQRRRIVTCSSSNSSSDESDDDEVVRMSSRQRRRMAAVTVPDTPPPSLRRSRPSAVRDDSFTGVVPRIFACPWCGTVLRSVTSALSHYEEHRDIDVFVCGICKEGFIGKALFEAHNVRHSKNAVAVMDELPLDQYPTSHAVLCCKCGQVCALDRRICSQLSEIGLRGCGKETFSGNPVYRKITIYNRLDLANDLSSPDLQISFVSLFRTIPTFCYICGEEELEEMDKLSAHLEDAHRLSPDNDAGPIGHRSKETFACKSCPIVKVFTHPAVYMAHLANHALEMTPCQELVGSLPPVPEPQSKSDPIKDEITCDLCADDFAPEDFNDHDCAVSHTRRWLFEKTGAVAKCPSVDLVNLRVKMRLDTEITPSLVLHFLRNSYPVPIQNLTGSDANTLCSCVPILSVPSPPPRLDRETRRNSKESIVKSSSIRGGSVSPSSSRLKLSYCKNCGNYYLDLKNHMAICEYSKTNRTPSTSKSPKKTPKDEEGEETSGNFHAKQVASVAPMITDDSISTSGSNVESSANTWLTVPAPSRYYAEPPLPGISPGQYLYSQLPPSSIPSCIPSTFASIFTFTTVTPAAAKVGLPPSLPTKSGPVYFVYGAAAQSVIEGQGFLPRSRQPSASVACKVPAATATSTSLSSIPSTLAPTNLAVSGSGQATVVDTRVSRVAATVTSVLGQIAQMTGGVVAPMKTWQPPILSTGGHTVSVSRTATAGVLASAIPVSSLARNNGPSSSIADSRNPPLEIIKTLQCPVCNKVCLVMPELKNHLVSLHVNPCSRCGKCFVDASKRDSHACLEDIIAANSPANFLCYFCTVSYRSVRVYYNHLIDAHPDRVRFEERSGQVFPVCGIVTNAKKVVTAASDVLINAPPASSSVSLSSQGAGGHLPADAVMHMDVDAGSPSPVSDSADAAEVLDRFTLATVASLPSSDESQSEDVPSPARPGSQPSFGTVKRRVCHKTRCRSVGAEEPEQADTDTDEPIVLKSTCPVCLVTLPKNSSMPAHVGAHVKGTCCPLCKTELSTSSAALSHVLNGCLMAQARLDLLVPKKPSAAVTSKIVPESTSLATTPAKTGSSASGARSAEFQCGLCNEMFVKMNHLLKHVAKHSSNDYKFCYVCNKSFSTLRKFKDHLLTHAVDGSADNSTLDANYGANSPMVVLTKVGGITRGNLVYPQKATTSSNLVLAVSDSADSDPGQLAVVHQGQQHHSLPGNQSNLGRLQALSENIGSFENGSIPGYVEPARVAGSSGSQDDVIEIIEYASSSDKPQGGSLDGNSGNNQMDQDDDDDLMVVEDLTTATTGQPPKACRTTDFPKPQREPKHKCSVCHKMFYTSLTLKEHMLYHSQDAGGTVEETLPVPFNTPVWVCRVCCIAFGIEDQYRRHASKHTGFVSCEDCSALCMTRDQVKVHAESHQKIVFGCSLCFQAMRSEMALHLHMLSLHGFPLIWFCKACSAGHDDREMVIKHIRSVHSSLVHKHAVKLSVTARLENKAMLDQAVRKELGVCCHRKLHFQPDPSLDPASYDKPEGVEVGECAHRTFMAYSETALACGKCGTMLSASKFMLENDEARNNGQIKLNLVETIDVSIFSNLRQLGMGAKRPELAPAVAAAPATSRFPIPAVRSTRLISAAIGESSENQLAETSNTSLQMPAPPLSSNVRPIPTNPANLPFEDNPISYVRMTMPTHSNTIRGGSIRVQSTGASYVPSTPRPTLDSSLMAQLRNLPTSVSSRSSLPSFSVRSTPTVSVASNKPALSAASNSPAGFSRTPQLARFSSSPPLAAPNSPQNSHPTSNVGRTICSVCQASFSSAASYKVHSLKHTTATHFCLDCGVCFNNHVQLLTHSLTHSQRLTYSLKCSWVQCGKQFDSIDAFIEHTHPVMFRCDRCMISFFNRSSYDSHVALGCHGCTCLFCGHSDNSQQHLIRHAVDEWYMCRECGLCYKNDRQTNAHYSSEHQAVEVHSGFAKCSICKLVLTDFDSHMRKKHVVLAYKIKQVIVLGDEYNKLVGLEKTNNGLVLSTPARPTPPPVPSAVKHVVASLAPITVPSPPVLPVIPGVRVRPAFPSILPKLVPVSESLPKQPNAAVVPIMARPASANGETDQSMLNTSSVSTPTSSTFPRYQAIAPALAPMPIRWESVWICQNCSFIFKTMANVKDHAFAHADDKTNWKPSYWHVRVAFQPIDNIAVIQLNDGSAQNSNRLATCDICDHTDKLVNITDHLRARHEQQGLFPCPECSEEFVSGFDTDYHLLFMHCDDRVLVKLPEFVHVDDVEYKKGEDCEKAVFHCLFCSFSTFASLDLIYHLATVHGAGNKFPLFTPLSTQVHICLVCGLTFKDLRVLEIHILHHRETIAMLRYAPLSSHMNLNFEYGLEGLEGITCMHCSEQFPVTENMYAHLMAKHDSKLNLWHRSDQPHHISRLCRICRFLPTSP